MKLIKFDLPIDGIKVKNLDELKDHLTLEVVGHFRSGLLIKWLKTRGELSIVDDLNEISAGEDRGVFEGVCTALGAAVDKDVLDCIFSEAPEKTGKNLRQFCDAPLSNNEIKKCFVVVISAVLAQKTRVSQGGVFEISVDDVVGGDLSDVGALALVFEWLDEIMGVVDHKYPDDFSARDFFWLARCISDIRIRLMLMQMENSGKEFRRKLNSLTDVG